VRDNTIVYNYDRNFGHSREIPDTILYEALLARRAEKVKVKF
jgi:hypothetical protein